MVGEQGFDSGLWRGGGGLKGARGWVESTVL
jgi:hypothetical protein